MITLHPAQSTVYKDIFINKVARYFPVACSRGWGKSYFLSSCAQSACFELMALPASVPNKRVAIIAPTYDQVTEIFWPILAHDMGMEDLAIKSSQDQGRFFLPNNVELRLISYEAVQRMRGKGYYFVGWDEIRDCTKGIDQKKAWESVIQPCITTRWSPMLARQYGAPSPGRAVITSTTNGYDFFYEMHNYEEKDPNWKSYQYDYHSSPYLDPAEIEDLKNKIDPRQFAAEYLAQFKDSGNSVFYMFDRKKHVRVDIPDLQPGEDVHISIDFNVGVMAASMFVVRGSQMHFLKDYMGHPDTETLANVLKEEFLNKGHKVYCYPDPTGHRRQTSAPVGRSDFSLLRAAGLIVLARTKSPGIADSVQAVNRRLMTANGTISMFFHPRAENTIASMERTRWIDKNPDTATLDKSQGFEHHSDGVRYATEFLFPVQSSSTASARGFKF